MVVFDLICTQGHRFEGWFDDLSDLERQLQVGLLVCPVCGDTEVNRRPSTFGLVRKGSEKAPQSPPAPGAPQPLEKLIQKWAELSERLDREFMDVGTDFTEEALKMHYGVTDRKNIRGHSTEEQDALLKKEGVTVFKLPVLRKNTSSTS